MAVAKARRQSKLFLRLTGLSLPSYRKLTELGVEVGNMTDGVHALGNFEKKSIEGLVSNERG